jgi:multiple sugar transport system ATP-binding protein
MQQIELRRVSKHFGKVTAVDNLSLVIEPGSFLTLLGPSGCGKTTVLRMIAGLEEPDSGEILIDGKTVYSFDDGIFVPPARRGLGLVFQSYALWPHLTVFQNVSFGLELAKMAKPRVRQRVMAILADLQMGGLEERYPQEMSGGQQQRVALARMLAPSPGIFLLDEPLSNLDARLRVDMRSELKRLHKDRGATTVYVTHDQLEALTMSTKIAVMKDGKLQQLASPTQVYGQPANIFVADFIGTPKVNLLEATAISSSEGTTVQVADVRIPNLPVAASGPVVISIRPEDIRISMTPLPGGAEFSVYSVLPAGSEVIVNLRRGNLMLTAKEDRAVDIEMDRAVWVTFDVAAINVYDKESTTLIPASVGRRAEAPA